MLPAPTSVRRAPIESDGSSKPETHALAACRVSALLGNVNSIAPAGNVVLMAMVFFSHCCHPVISRWPLVWSWESFHGLKLITKLAHFSRRNKPTVLRL
jgi:hypothetical protein